MKFNKLVKTIDYVTYPSFQELRSINQKLGDSVVTITEIIISAIIAVLLDKTTIIQFAVTKIADYKQNAFLQGIAQNNTPISLSSLSTIIAIFIGIVVCVLIRIIPWIYVRCRYRNKRKVSQREDLARAFYKLVIPQLITIKSLIEQHDESDIQSSDKRFLLLLQVKYEICDLLTALNGISVLEYKTNGTLRKDSEDLLRLIGCDSYYAVLTELTKCATLTRTKLATYGDKADDLVNSLDATIKSSKTILSARIRNDELATEYSNYEELTKD